MCTIQPPQANTPRPARHELFHTNRRDTGIWVVVPAFQESAAIGATVSELCDAGYGVVVVDDGSTDATATIARQSGAVVLRHVINRGQGAALQTGFGYCLARQANIIVTFDADGQHDVNDIPTLVAALQNEGADVVLGSRFLGSTVNMSISRQFVLRLAVRFTRLSSGLPVTDTHNGLRAFSRRAVQTIQITMDRMAHASEILDQIQHFELEFIEVPVTIRYTPYSKLKGQTNTMAAHTLVEYFVNKVLR